MPPHLTWQDIEDKIDALAVRFQAGEFSETVYRASLIGLARPDEINNIVRRQLEIQHGQKSSRIPRGHP